MFSICIAYLGLGAQLMVGVALVFFKSPLGNSSLLSFLPSSSGGMALLTKYIRLDDCSPWSSCLNFTFESQRLIFLALQSCQFNGISVNGVLTGDFLADFSGDFLAAVFSPGNQKESTWGNVLVTHRAHFGSITWNDEWFFKGIEWYKVLKRPHKELPNEPSLDM